jgi:hypothetical protein
MLEENSEMNFENIRGSGLSAHCRYGSCRCKCTIGRNIRNKNDFRFIYIRENMAIKTVVDEVGTVWPEVGPHVLCNIMQVG